MKGRMIRTTRKAGLDININQNNQLTNTNTNTNTKYKYKHKHKYKKGIDKNIPGVHLQQGGGGGGGGGGVVVVKGVGRSTQEKHRVEGDVAFPGGVEVEAGCQRKIEAFQEERQRPVLQEDLGYVISNVI